MIIFAVILGCCLGFGAAYAFVGMKVNDSNNKGDSKGTFRDFSERPMYYVEMRDRIKKPGGMGLF